MKLLKILGLVAILSHSNGLIIKSELNVGLSSPVGDLAKLIEPGIIYQGHFFAGVPLKNKTVSAAGWGIDLSFADYNLKSNDRGHYRRYTTDFFFFPINGGLYSFTPGINISMSDVEFKNLNIEEFSIRPALLAQFGLHLPITKSFRLNAYYRYEYVIQDMEYSTSANKDFNLSSQFSAYTGGFEVDF